MTPELSASYDFCDQVARREAKNFYPSFRLLPADRRRSMSALYAFMRRTDDIADGDPSDPAENRRTSLDDWKAQLDHALVDTGADPGRWPGWPALADTVRRRGIPRSLLDDVVTGVALDLEPRPHHDYAELDRYCYHVAGAVGLCCLHIWGFRSDGGRAEAAAIATGRALQVTNILRDVAEDARNGRVYLPQDEMERFGVRRSDLLADHASDPLRRLLAFEVERAYDDYRQAEALAPLVDPVGRPMLRALVGIYRSLLDEIVRRRFDVLKGRVSVPAWRKAAVVAGAFARRFLPTRSQPPEVFRP